MQVDEIFVHGNYTAGGSKENDIALLRLGEKTVCCQCIFGPTKKFSFAKNFWVRPNSLFFHLSTSSASKLGLGLVQNKIVILEDFTERTLQMMTPATFYILSLLIR